ncbi:uncharacterized protein [Typha angustifolia]|uniref:uncharacterized protein n=1 Tax=Typha angustifolia TaxID=59011 RepID=UPI003C3059BE
MERRGGCCIARFGGDADVAWRVGRIMLRFRPIAPKPAAGSGAGAEVAATGGGGRSKRKATGGAGGREGKRGRKPKKVESRGEETAEKEEKSASSSSSAPSSMTDSSPIVTLPLMPETPERRDACPSPPTPAAAYEPPPWFRREPFSAASVVIPRPLRPAASWFTVERVTATWQDREEGSQMKSALEEDEAPGFTSDEWGRVTWTNEAYRRMVFAVGAAAEEQHVRVGLVTNGIVPAWGTCGGFTCRARVRYACGRKGRGSLAAPCDVWRLEGGAYAWRLDVKAALSLGLGFSLH